VVDQIVPGCSVKRRKSTPCRACASVGITHQIAPSAVSSAVRQPKPITGRHPTSPASRS
jgi:hypothetical protein